jgi:hypothetical protein
VDIKKFSHIYWKVFISVLAAGFLGILSYAAMFYVHEAGHVVVGSIIQIIRLKVPIPVISNWTHLWFIPLPQQVKVLGLGHNIFFALAGSAFVLIFVMLITLRLFNRRRKYTWISLALPIVFLFHELVGNFLFGTDNHLGTPVIDSATYSWLNYFVTVTPWALGAIAFAFIYNHAITEKIVNTIQDRVSRTAKH